MCWRDNVQMLRHCSLCGQNYVGALGHIDCPKSKKKEGNHAPDQPAQKKE